VLKWVKVLWKAYVNFTKLNCEVVHLGQSLGPTLENLIKHLTLNTGYKVDQNTLHKVLTGEMDPHVESTRIEHPVLSHISAVKDMRNAPSNPVQAENSRPSLSSPDKH